MRKRMKGTTGIVFVCLVLAGCFCLPLTEALGAVVIDNFEVHQGSGGSPILSTTSPAALGPASIQDAGATNIVGEWRHVYLTQSSSTGERTETWVDTGANQWAVANQPGATGFGRVVWNGSSNAANFSLGANFNNLNYISINEITAELATNFYLDIYTSAGVWSRATIPVLAGTTSNIHVAAGSFIAQAGGGALLNNINRIELSFDEVERIDITVKRLDAEFDTPEIVCFTKRWTLNSNYTSLSQTINLPAAQTFPVTLYVEYTVHNNGTGADRVYIEDTLPSVPTAMTLASVTAESIEEPAGFALGDASGVGPGVVSWTSTSELQGGETLRFRYRVTIGSTFDGSLTNSFQARGLTETQFSDTPCPSYVIHQTEQRVPSLNEWGAIILSLLLAVSAVWLIRKRRTS